MRDATNSKRVLLIEDEPYILWLIRYLEDRGVQVQWAKSVEEARLAIRNPGDGGYDAVIVDVLMPAKDEKQAQEIGLILADEIQSAFGKTTRIVIYSVLTSEQFRKKVERLKKDQRLKLSLGDVQFISKREPEDELKNYLETELGIRRSLQ